LGVGLNKVGMDIIWQSVEWVASISSYVFIIFSDKRTELAS